jgi:hypothetical protein
MIRGGAAPPLGGRGLVPFVALGSAATVGAALPVARPGPGSLAIAAFGLLPLGALVLFGTKRAAVTLAALVYIGVLMWAYPRKIVPTYAYQGLIDAAPAVSALAIAGVLAVAPSAWLPVAARRPSTLLLWIVYLAGYVPAIVVPVFIVGRVEAVLPFDVALLASMAIVGLLVRLPPAPLTIAPLSLSTFTRVLVGLSLLSLIYVAATFGIHAPPSLADIYSTRAEFAAEVPASLAGGYIVPWASNALHPMLLALGIARRRLSLVLLALAGQGLIYSVTGYRTTLFSVLLTPLVYFGVTRARASFGLLATAAASAILLFAVASPLTSVETRALATRTLATPAEIGWFYYDYFSVHQPYRLSHSFLRSFEARPYIEEPADLIGPLYFAPDKPSANANLWADAFANFRLWGVILFTFALALALLVVDGLGRDRDLRVAGGMLAMVGLSLTNSGFFTVVLTLGLAFGSVLLALMPAMSEAPARAAPHPADGRGPVAVPVGRDG